MRYLVDTDWIIHALNDIPSVVQRLNESPDREMSRLLIATLRYAFDPSGPRQTDEQ